MQQIIEEVKENFQSFIEDEEKLIMIIEATAEESMLLLKTLDMLEEDEMSPDVFMTHVENFSDARSYVQALFESQQIQLAAVNEILAERGEPTLEDFPDELSKRTIINHERLIGIVAHVRKIVEPDRKAIWSFFPLDETEHQQAFTNLLRFLITEVLEEKIERTKLIVRDTVGSTLKTQFEDFDEKIIFYNPRLDLDSMFEKIEKQSKDPNVPPDERAQNLMLMAGVDIAEKRFDDALEKNGKVLNYFEKSDQKQKQSVVHNNIGDIYYLQGEFPKAQNSYEKAVSIAIDEKSQPLVIYQSINAGNSLFMQKKYDEALVYYDSAEKLAEINQVVMQQVQALERAGDTQKAQGETDKAIENWEKAAKVCRENSYKIGMISVLEKLDAAYEETGQVDKRRKNQDELQECREDIRKVEPALLEK